jgi:hypothetical protein
MYLDAPVQEDPVTMIGTLLISLKDGKLTRTSYTSAKVDLTIRKCMEPKWKYSTNLVNNLSENHFSLDSKMEELLKLLIMISILMLTTL